jgi:predicted secreted acid phosphatase
MNERDMLKATMSNSKSNIIFLDIERKYVDISDCVFIDSNLKKTDLVGKSIQEAFQNEEWTKIVAESHKQVIESGEAMEFEEYAIINGKKIFYSALKFPVFNSGGKIIGTGAISNYKK